MALKVPNEGELEALNELRTNWGTLQVGLFKSAHVPGDTDTLATYAAIECDFPGYARQNAMNWLAPATDMTGRAVTQADAVTFTRNAGGAMQSIFGYFVVSPGGKVRWAETDPNAPVPINVMGATYSLIPVFTARSES